MAPTNIVFKVNFSQLYFYTVIELWFLASTAQLAGDLLLNMKKTCTSRIKLRFLITHPCAHTLSFSTQ